VAPAQALQYESTGIGVDQRVDLEGYSLKLMFFVETGPYLANMDVVIENEFGETVLQTNSYGPWLFVNLNPGGYKVTATRQNGDQEGFRFRIHADEPVKTIALMYPNRNT
jgi:hypothetical protein